MNIKKPNSFNGGGSDSIRQLYTSRPTRRLAIALLKAERTYEETRKLLPKLGLHSTGSELREVITGVVTATNWDQVMAPSVLPPSKDWLQELGWLAHGFRVEAKRLTSFISLRKQFGRAYLLGNYTIAKQVLAKVAEQHGHSLWLAERQFMVLQSTSGFEDHKRMLSEIQTSLTNSLLAYLVTALSNRLEPYVTPEAFQRLSQQALNAFRADGHSTFASWIELHIAPWEFNWTHHKHDMLSYCHGKCLIDRYNSATAIISSLPIADLDTKERDLFHTIIKDLELHIEDRQLKHLSSALASKPRKIDPATDEYFLALDSFLSAKYNECAAITHSLLREQPACFESYWLLAKAIACSEEPIPITLPENSVARQILENLCQIAKNNTSINHRLSDLKMIALKLGDNNLGHSLRQFAGYEELGQFNANAAQRISMQSKLDLCPLHRPHESSTPINEKQITNHHYHTHPSVQLESYCNGALPPSTIADTIAPHFAALARANRALLLNDYPKVLEFIEFLLISASASSAELRFHGASIAFLQFEALTQLDRAEDAAKEITNHYLNNPNNLRHVPFQRLIEGCAAGRWSSLKRLPCWPILTFLNNGSEQDIYEAIDDLLIEHRAETPFALSDGTIHCSQNELRILLRDVMVSRVISRGALWNRTAGQRREMRRHFLQILYSLSVDDQALVVEELSQLEQAQLLEQAYRNIEGPKFELSYSSLNREIAKACEGTFARYSEYRQYEMNGGTLVNEDDLLSSARDGKAVAPDPIRRSETSALLLRQLLLEPFIQYILDTNVGINAFLGTRIRHGSLENQITRVLGAHSLLALKNSSGSYVCDSYVLNLVKAAPNKVRESISDAYFTFTDSVNSLVDKLVNSVLRVRIPESVLTLITREGFKTSELRGGVGLLDFSALFCDDTANSLEEVPYSSVSALLSEAERLFIIEANKAFANVKEHIERNVFQEIGDALTKLDNDIQHHLPESPERVALRSKILAAKGEYFQDLKIISTWFSAAEPSETGLGSVDEVISMAGRVVEFASNGKVGQIEMEVLHNEKVSIEVGRIMYEVVSILLRNVAQHSRIESGQRVTFAYSANGNSRCLGIKSRVCDVNWCAESVNRANKAISIPYDEWALGKAPGGTGFVRIRKLLKQAGFPNVSFSVGQIFDQNQFHLQINFCR